MPPWPNCISIGPAPLICFSPGPALIPQVGAGQSSAQGQCLWLTSPWCPLTPWVIHSSAFIQVNHCHCGAHLDVFPLPTAPPVDCRMFSQAGIHVEQALHTKLQLYLSAFLHYHTAQAVFFCAKLVSCVREGCHCGGFLLPPPLVPRSVLLYVFLLLSLE